jgi:RimJ/RimL family protein N-acetyltransferase
MNVPTIETERLRLRAFEGGDLEPYAEMCADERFEAKPTNVYEILDPERAG